MIAAQKPATLRSRREFRRVYEQGQRFHSPFFSAFVLPKNEANIFIGITVTRKIGNAVVRNRCKRRLREIVRRYFASGTVGPITRSYELVLNAKHPLIDAEFAQLEASFAGVMGKIHASLRVKEEPPVTVPVGESNTTS